MGSVADYIAEKRKKNPALRIGSLKEITESQKRPPLSSGNLVLDYVTSIGGIPAGLVTEFRGFTGSGKSTAAAMIAADHQKKVYAGEASGAILYLDYEYAVDEAYFANLGLDVTDEDTFVYFQPDTLEQGFQMFLEMIKQGLLALGIVDSIAGASSEFEYEHEIGKASVGNKAKGLNQALRMCIGPMRVYGTGLLLINHEQIKIPNSFAEKQAAMRGIQETISPGGKAIEYYTSQRVAFSKPTLNKEEVKDELTNDKAKQVTSTEVLVTCFKNKVGIPYRQGKMRVEFGRGFVQAYSAFQILVDHKIIKKKAGGNFEFPEQLLPESGIKIPVGESKVVDAIEADPAWEAKIVSVARALVLREQTDETSPNVVVTEDDESIDLETGEVLEDE